MGIRRYIEDISPTMEHQMEKNMDNAMEPTLYMRVYTPPNSRGTPY